MKKKNFLWQQYLVIAFFLMLGLACGIVMGAFLKNSSRAGATLDQQIVALFFLFVGMYVSIFLQTIIHEGGHLIFGLLTGYRFSSFRIGGLMWLKQGDQVVLRWMRLAGTSGQCLMAPPDLVDGKMPFALYNLGGCICNLAACLVFYMVFLLVPADSLWARQLLILVLVGGALALMNGIPLRLGTVDNDGRNALSLGKDAGALRSFWIQMKANELLAKGVRIKDMPAEWFELPQNEDMKNSMTASAAVFSCNRLMDEHRFQEAQEQIERILALDSGMVGLHRNLLGWDQLYCELVGLNRRNVVEEMLTKEQRKFMKSMRTFPTVMRTEYVYALLAERDQEEAEKRRRLFEKRAVSYPYPSDIQSERELMEIARQRAMGAMACDADSQ